MAAGCHDGTWSWPCGQKASLGPGDDTQPAAHAPGQDLAVSMSAQRSDAQGVDVLYRGRPWVCMCKRAAHHIGRVCRLSWCLFVYTDGRAVASHRACPVHRLGIGGCARRGWLARVLTSVGLHVQVAGTTDGRRRLRLRLRRTVTNRFTGDLVSGRPCAPAPALTPLAPTLTS